MNCPKCRAPLEPHQVTPATVVDACPRCFGVYYDEADLAVPLKLDVMAASGLGCPRCGKQMESGQAGGGKLVVDRCPGCRGIWFDMGEVQALRKLAGVEQIAAAGALKEASREKKAPSAKAPQPSDMSGVDNPDASIAPTVVHEGLRFAHFQTSIALTTHVLGEFPWLAAAGDRVRARDFVAPPFMLSQEVSEGESTWSRGEYVTPEEVWAAFGPKDARPPVPRGVAPAQPNPWRESLSAMSATFLPAAAAATALFIAASMFSSGKMVFNQAFSFEAADPEKSRVSEVFEVPGRASNIKATVESNLQNHWAYANLALINADTDEAVDFGVELSFYSGVDDGERWSEGGPNSTVYVPGVPPGRYYLRIEPQTDQYPLVLRVVLVRDVPLARLPLIVLLLLFLPLAWAFIRRETFENQRWMESDHPRVSESDDEDWEDDE